MDNYSEKRRVRDPANHHDWRKRVAIDRTLVNTWAMEAIRFTTDIGPDGTIPIPPGVVLPPGPAGITVVMQLPAAKEAKGSPATRDWLLALAVEAEADSLPLPADLAANHDWYAHGKPAE